jgi:dTDP-4-dehydrorhamnose reductase
MKTVLIFGNGYVAKFVAKEFSKLAYLVYCTSRQPEAIVSSAAQGNIHIIPYYDARLPAILKKAQVVLSTVPPDEIMIDPVLARYAKIIAQEQFAWIGYLSSTAVYGNHHGQWVSETTTCLPSTAKANIRLLAEQQWLALYVHQQLPVHILRLSGIYGPGQNCLEDIKQGKNYTIVKVDQYFSRIHIADIWQAISAAIQRPTPGEIYNVSDDEPAPLHIVQQFGAQILQHKPLTEVVFADASLSSAAARFFNDNKKVNNAKIVKNLHVKWCYPNYRLGLTQGCLPYLR